MGLDNIIKKGCILLLILVFLVSIVSALESDLSNYLSSQNVKDVYIYDITKDSLDYTTWYNDSTKSWWQKANDTIVDNYAIFDGSDDFIDFGDMSPVEGISEMTVSLWVKRDVDTQHIEKFLEKWGNSGDRTYLLQVQNNDKIYFCIADNTGNHNTEYCSESTWTIPVGSWHHIVGRWSSNGDVELFIDGSINGTTGSRTGTTYDSSASVIAGAYYTGLYEFNGYMDEGAIFNRSLSSSEISSLYQRGLNHLPNNITDGLVGYWNFEQLNCGTTTDCYTDQSGNGNDGTAVGNTKLSGRSSKTNFPTKSYLVLTDNGLDILDAENESNINFWISTDIPKDDIALAENGNIYLSKNIGVYNYSYIEDNYNNLVSSGDYDNIYFDSTQTYWSNSTHLIKSNTANDFSFTESDSLAINNIQSITSNNNYIFAANSSGIQKIDKSTFTFDSTIYSGNITGLSLSEDNNYIYVSSFLDGLYEINLSDNSINYIKTGNAIEFKGLDNDGGSATFNEVVQWQNHTVFMWYRLNRIPSGSIDRMYLWSNDLDGASEGCGFFINTGGFSQYRCNDITDEDISSSLSTPVDTWVFGAARYNGTAICIWYNNNKYCDASIGNILWANENDWELGRRVTANDFHADARIDEYYAFNRSLSDEEVLQAYNSGLSEQSLQEYNASFDFTDWLVYLNFDNKSYSDSSGNNRDLSVSLNPVYFNGGLYGDLVSYDFTSLDSDISTNFDDKTYDRTLLIGTAEGANSVYEEFTGCIDNDLDGWGAVGSDLVKCTHTGAYDCVDANSDINPDATDIPNNGIDEDCSGADATANYDVDIYFEGETAMSGLGYYQGDYIGYSIDFFMDGSLHDFYVNEIVVNLTDVELNTLKSHTLSGDDILNTGTGEWVGEFSTFDIGTLQDDKVNLRVYVYDNNGDLISWAPHGDEWFLSGTPPSYTGTDYTVSTSAPTNTTVEDLVVEKPSGKIDWSNSRLDLSQRNIDFDSAVNILDDFIYVDSSSWPELNSSSNTVDSIATLTFNDVNCDLPIIYYSSTATTKEAILAENKICPDDICSNIECSNGVLSVDVSRFSGYTTDTLANLTIYDINDSTNYDSGAEVTFYANYTNITTGNMITGADCNISFEEESYSTNHSMTWNGINYEYDKIVADGNWNYKVSCDAVGYNILTTTDSYTVGEIATPVPEFSTIILLVTIVCSIIGLVMVRKE